MKNKVFLFIIGLVALLAFQSKIVMPFVKDIASSDLFLEDSGDELNRISSLNIMTLEAFKQCNDYISNEDLADIAVTFADKPINAFSLGNYQYVINADLEITPSNAASFTKKYACRIKYSNGSDTSDLSIADNWSVNAISGLDDIEAN